MKLSERVGYVIEHMLLIELERKRIPYTRSEQVTNEAIKSDISVQIDDREIVLFVTHTRTQGMTNRKFYRTIEELAQRRLVRPNALCVEISLVRGRSGVRKQQDLIFSELFDATYEITEKSSEDAFVEFVDYLGDPLTIEKTREKYREAPSEILAGVRSIVSKAIALRGAKSSLVENWWQLEQVTKRGTALYASEPGVSIKLGMKMLSLMDTETFTLNEIAGGQCRKKPGLSEDTAKHVLRVGVVEAVTKVIGGMQVVFSKHATAAAEFCVRTGLELVPNWYGPYLKTLGAQRLRSDLMDIAAVARRNESLNELLQSCGSSEELAALLQKDYRSDDARCDLFDMAIRASGYTQNELSVAILDSSDINVHVSDSIVYVINKSDDAETIIGDVDDYISGAAASIWRRCEGLFKTVAVDVFYLERLKTYFSNAFVTPEHFLLEECLSSMPLLKSSRASVLPRICSLERRYRMSVVGAKHWTRNCGRKAFLVTVSTPEKRHHKHKEFSGKIRAIRYDFALESGLSDSKTDFFIVIDGHWTEEQISMLCLAGWNVLDWDSFFLWISSDVQNQVGAGEASDGSKIFAMPQ